jgi:hypothetical protein
MLSRGEKLLVVAAEWRAAVARDEACGIQARRTVASDLRHGQANQSLDARQEDMAGRLRILLIETDRTLVDSH